MTSSHRHGTGKYALAGDIDAALSALADRVTAQEQFTALLSADTSNLSVDLAALEARVAALEPVAAPVLTDLPGWRLVFADEFDRDVALGHFMDGATDLGTSIGWLTADGRYKMARTEWKDTSGRGTRGDGAIVELTGGQMVQHPYTDATGFGHNCILTPMPPGSSSRGGIVGGRFLARFRGALLAGHKSVPLLWPDLQGGADSPNKMGEIDWAEASWDKPPKAYMHSADGFASNVQAWFAYPAGVDFRQFHDYVVEWIPGTSVRYLCDDVQIGLVTEGQVIGGATMHVPVEAMHFNLQFETSTDGEALVPNTAGLIEIERVGIWAPA
jgi:hypothetical protein